MKNSQGLAYEKKSGKVKAIGKDVFIKYLKKLTKNNKNIKNLDNLTYSQMVKKYENMFISQTNGIYFLKSNNKEIILTCLINKTFEDFNKLCKKNNWKVVESNTNDKLSQKSIKQVVKKEKKEEKINKVIRGNKKGNEEEKKMFKINQKRIIKLTAAAIAVAMVGVGSVACSKPDTIKSYEYETSTYKEQVIKDIDSNVKESAQNSKVEIDLNKNEVNIEKTNENKANNESNMMLSGQISEDSNSSSNTNIAVNNTGYKEYKEGDPKPITDDVNEYRDWLRAQNKHPQGTDLYGNPFKKEGVEYTWSASGEPNEAPTNGITADGVQNPNTGTKYKYSINYGWKIDNTDEINAEAKRMNDLMNYGGVDEKNGEVYRKLTPEELKEISAMYSASFK